MFSPFFVSLFPRREGDEICKIMYDWTADFFSSLPSKAVVVEEEEEEEPAAEEEGSMT